MLAHLYTRAYTHTYMCTHRHTHTHAQAHAHTQAFASLIPRALQGMKLTSEEFNAIFTFYDKVRGRTAWEGKAGAPSAGEPPATWLRFVLRSKEELSTAPSPPAHNFTSEPSVLLGSWEGEDPLTARHPFLCCPDLCDSNSLPYNQSMGGKL